MFKYANSFTSKIAHLNSYHLVCTFQLTLKIYPLTNSTINSKLAFIRDLKSRMCFLFQLGSICHAGSKILIDEEGFRNALYMIDIGENGLLLALYASNLAYAPVIENIPSFLAEIKLAIQVSLYLHIIILLCL